MQKMQSIKGFVDRIEGTTAVVLLGDDESVKVNLPVSWLPNGIKEGTVIKFGVSVDEDATNAGKGRVQSLLDSMPNEP